MKASCRLYSLLLDFALPLFLDLLDLDLLALPLPLRFPLPLPLPPRFPLPLPLPLSTNRAIMVGKSVGASGFIVTGASVSLIMVGVTVGEGDCDGDRDMFIINGESDGARDVSIMMGIDDGVSVGAAVIFPICGMLVGIGVILDGVGTADGGSVMFVMTGASVGSTTGATVGEMVGLPSAIDGMFVGTRSRMQASSVAICSHSPTQRPLPIKQPDPSLS